MAMASARTGRPTLRREQADRHREGASRERDGVLAPGAEVGRGKNMTVSELARKIAERFGLEVDERTLDRLTQTARVRRPDIERPGAVAAVLDVGLDDVFAVEAVPITDESMAAETEEEDSVLTPAQSQRLRQFYEQRGQRALTEDEWAEMDALVALYGRRLYEQGVRDIAKARGRPVEQTQADSRQKWSGPRPGDDNWKLIPRDRPRSTRPEHSSDLVQLADVPLLSSCLTGRW